MAAAATDNSIIVNGNYLQVKRLGKPDVFFSKKNTTFNLVTGGLEMNESNDGGKIVIPQSEVDLALWGLSTGVTDWNKLVTFLAENTANFNTATGGSVAPLVWIGKFQAAETPTIRTNHSTLGNPVISRLSGGLYKVTFPTDVFTDQTKIYVTSSDEALSRSVLSSQGVNYVELSVYNQSEVQSDTNASFQVKIEYYG